MRRFQAISLRWKVRLIAASTAFIYERQINAIINKQYKMQKISLSHQRFYKTRKHSSSLLQSASVRELSCTLVEESKTRKDSKPLEKKNHPSYWTAEQQDYFIIFWILEICDNPNINYFFSLPLKRNCYFKDISQFITHHLGQEKQKTKEQCKSKFSSIKKKINSDKMKGKVPLTFQFIDYLKAEANKRQCYSEKIKEALRKLQSMESSVSELVLSIREMKRYQNSCEMNYKNNRIYKYLINQGEQIDESQ